MNERKADYLVEVGPDYESWRPKRQLLILMAGVPGSGKSYFSRNLAHTLGFKRFSTDAIRTELFGRPDPEPLELYNVATFQALNQRVEEALLAGHSVIRDHMQHRSYWREAIGQHQAGLVEAQLMTIWIKTPHDLAHERAMARELRLDQRTEPCPLDLQERIEYFHDCIEFTPDDKVLEIDGRLDFANQLNCFIEFCDQLK